jgi:hypothetical protein
MTASRVLFIGPGVIAIDHANLPELAPLGLAERHIYRNTAIYFAALSRIPRTALSPQRLAGLIGSGQIKEDDSGYPGPCKNNVMACFSMTLLNHQEIDQEKLKAALRDLYTAARSGVPEAKIEDEGAR